VNVTRACLTLFLCAVSAAAQTWVPQESGTKVALRGISAVSETVAWASGAKGTVLRTIDGGATWRAVNVPGAADLDFRGIRALDERTAFVLSSGKGPLSRIYKTSDAGATWHLLQINPDPKGFWDGLKMWDPEHGIVVGDPVNGRFDIWTTFDGENWHGEKGPAATAHEGVFAASNSALAIRGAHEAWFGTGGTGDSRVLHTDDGGKSWTAAKTPIRNDSDNAGIFSLAFSNARHGIAVGGDFMKPAMGAMAITDDAGKSWSLGTLPGYRSAVVYVADAKLWIATGTSGTDTSMDGKTWTGAGAGFNAIGMPWAVGADGVIAKFQ
jgi:photosystem II stability/assembly factor-like uncharacterized protein